MEKIRELFVDNSQTFLYFLMKIYVVGTCLNGLTEAILKGAQNMFSLKIL